MRTRDELPGYVVPANAQAGDVLVRIETKGGEVVGSAQVIGEFPKCRHGNGPLCDECYARPGFWKNYAAQYSPISKAELIEKFQRARRNTERRIADAILRFEGEPDVVQPGFQPHPHFDGAYSTFEPGEVTVMMDDDNRNVLAMIVCPEKLDLIAADEPIIVEDRA